MIASAKQLRRRPAPAWHGAFLAMLPAIIRHAKIAFRGHDPELAELVQETVANCLVAFVRLVELEKSDLAYAGALARYAVAQIRDGRKVGTPLRINEVLSRYSQRRKGFSVERLDKYDRTDSSWMVIVVEDRRATPADIAAMRIDFAAWLGSLPSRNREIAEDLATGETTRDVASKFQVSAGRVSQLRRELKDSWEAFVGQTQDRELQTA